MANSFQLIAPAGKTSDINLENSITCMAHYGYELKKDYLKYDPISYLAADDSLRLSSLETAWLSQQTLICLRGGYGCTRILDQIDWKKLKETENQLIGHSDISALHLAFLKHGIKRTISGIMAAAEFLRNPDTQLTIKSLNHCLKKETFSHEWLPKYNSKTLFKTEGFLVPVTLSVLCSMLGSKHIPNFSGAILIIEDINEAPYKIDRMLTQLKLAGIPQISNAIVMGDFNNCGDQSELHRIFADFAKDLDSPVISGLPFGHCLPRINLPVGALAQLNFQSTATLKIIEY
jgi:muramoyltetrapeptide carboxypeptidase